MQDLKKLRNLTVIVFVFSFLNFVTLTDTLSENEKPIIVVKEYYYYSFGDIEIRDPRNLDEIQLKEFKFEKVDIKSHKLYKFIGKNNTDYEIYIDIIRIDKNKKTVDLELITVRQYEDSEEIGFGEIEKILYNENLIELRGSALKAKFVEEGIMDGGGGYSSYYKLPLIYCMIENCNIGTSEDKRILDVSNFKDEKNITEGPYSAQNEKGQIIAWKSLEKHILPGESDKNTDKFLYLINAHERGIMGGGFEIDKTFMRETIDELADVFSKKFYRDIDTLEKRFNHFIEKIDSIIEDRWAKWSVMPFLWARYKNYMLFHEENRDYFIMTSGILPEDTKTEFRYYFAQEFGTEENDVKNLINSQIDHIYDKIEQNHEYYKRRIIDKYNSQMKDFDNIYLTIAAIYGIVFGLITLLCKIFWNKIKIFWNKSTNEKRRVLYIIILTGVIFIITYIIGYDAIVIHKINQAKVFYPYYLMTNTEKSQVLLFSFVAAGSWILWSFRDQIMAKSSKKGKRRA